MYASSRLSIRLHAGIMAVHIAGRIIKTPAFLWACSRPPKRIIGKVSVLARKGRSVHGLVGQMLFFRRFKDSQIGRCANECVNSHK